MDDKKNIKIVYINSPYQVVLNCGVDDGIKLNDTFLIYGLGPIIKDIDTNEELERLEIVRGRGKVTHLQNRICTLDSTMIDEKPKTIKRIKANTSFLLNTGATEETEIVREKKEFDGVQIGDRARKI